MIKMEAEKNSELGKQLVQAAANNDYSLVKDMLYLKPPSEILNFQNTGGNTALMQACILNSDVNSVKMVKALLAAGANMEVRNKFGVTALMHAARKGYIGVVKTLLDAGADFCALNDDGQNAYLMSKDKQVQALLKEFMDAKEAADRENKVRELGTRLLELIALQKESDIKAIVEANPNYPEIVNYISPEFKYDRNRPLFACVMLGLAEIVDFLLQYGADPDIVHEKDNATPLIRNCSQLRLPSYPTTQASRIREYFRQQITEKLLDCRADTTLVDKDGRTALMTAVYNNYEFDVNTILKKTELSINIVNKFGDSALHIAIRKGYLSMVQILLSHRPDVDIADSTQNTPLMLACWTGNLEIVYALLDANADVNLQSESGRTAIHWAVEKGHVEVVKALLQRRADVNAIIPLNETSCLMIATRLHNLALVDCLIAGGAKLNLQNAEGMTALMWACWNSYDEIVASLCAAGANPHLTDKGKKSAFDRCRKHSTTRAIKDNCLKIYLDQPASPTKKSTSKSLSKKKSM